VEEIETLIYGVLGGQIGWWVQRNGKHAGWMNVSRGLLIHRKLPWSSQRLKYQLKDRS